MYDEIDLNSAFNSVRDNISGREWSIANVKDKNKEKAKEIEDRLSNVNFNMINKLAIDSLWYRKTIFEIMWNEDFTIKEIIEQPREWFRFYESKWKIQKDGTWVNLPENKFIVFCNEPDKHNPEGRTIAKPLLKTYERKARLDDRIAYLGEKYGEVITIVGYAPDDPRFSGKTDEQIKETLGKDAESIRELKGKDVIMVPIDAGTKLTDYITHITLSDLKLEMQNYLSQDYAKKITRNITGSTLSSHENSSTGSYSQSQTHEKTAKAKEESRVKYLRDGWQRLIEIDAYFHGYNASDFYFKFEEEKNRKEEAETKEAEESAKVKELEKFGLVKELGYRVKKEYLANVLGVDANIFEEYEAPQVINSNQEFSKKKSKKELDLKLLERFERQSIETGKEIVEGISKSITDKVSRLKNIEDISELSFDYPIEFEEHMIIAHLIGVIDENKMHIAEFSEFEEEINPFKLPFDEAIKYLGSLEPELYENLGDITDTVKNNNFWIKKSTDKEVTNRLMKSLVESLESGETTKEWQKRITGIADKLGLGAEGSYLELVRRQNLGNARMAGLYQQQQKLMDFYEYGFYDAIDDSRTSLICKNLDGKCYRLDDPIWLQIMPKNHFGCRSNRITGTEEDMQDLDVDILKIGKQGTEAKTAIEALKKNGFEGNNAIDFVEKMKGNYNSKVSQQTELKKKLEKQLREKYETALKTEFNAEVNLSKLRIKEVRDVKNTLISLKKEYNKIRLNEIKALDFGKGVARHNRVDFKLEINSKFTNSFKSSKELEEEIMFYSNDNWWVSKDFSDIIIHEIGHNLTYVHSLEQGLTYKDIDLYGGPKDKNLEGLVISKYSQTNKKEMLAEAFVLYVRGEKDLIPKNILKDLKKYLGVE